MLCAARILALLTLVFASHTAHADDLVGRVVSVSDGDTISVLASGPKGQRAVKVRLHGIDCPESHQAFGSRAKQFTSDFAFGKQARVVVRDQDRYGRTVGEVFVADKSLNAELVKAGLAWAYVRYSKQFVGQEREAREAERGLWADKNPTPPWEFRRDGRGGKVEPKGEASGNKADGQAASADRVWVNLTSGVYWMPGTRYFGKTKRGEYMSEEEAKKRAPVHH